MTTVMTHQGRLVFPNCPYPKLTSKVTDMILGVAEQYNQLTTSDLQAIAEVVAGDIIGLVKTTKG